MMTGWCKSQQPVRKHNSKSENTTASQKTQLQIPKATATLPRKHTGILSNGEGRTSTHTDVLIQRNMCLVFIIYIDKGKLVRKKVLLYIVSE